MITYNFYWIFVIFWLAMMRYEETHGHYPFMKGGERQSDAASTGSKTGDMAAAAASADSQDKY